MKIKEGCGGKWVSCLRLQQTFNQLKTFVDNSDRFTKKYRDTAALIRIRTHFRGAQNADELKILSTVPNLL